MRFNDTKKAAMNTNIEPMMIQRKKPPDPKRKNPNTITRIEANRMWPDESLGNGMLAIAS